MASIEDMHTDDLAVRLFELKDHVEQPYLTEERKEQIRKEIGRISFELQERSKENA